MEVKMKYEEILEELQNYIDGCKRQKLSGNILVDKERIDEEIRKLSMNTPEEIKKYKHINKNKATILNEATDRAAKIIEDAKLEKEKLIAEHEIMQEAYRQGQELINDSSAQAQQILDSAVNDATDIRTSAMQYTDDILADLQNIIIHTMENVTSKYEGFMKAFNSSLDVITANRNELAPEESAPENNASVGSESLDVIGEDIDSEDESDGYDDMPETDDNVDYTVDIDNF